MTIPYTYLIKHIPTQRVYYGVRYARGCNPTDLFIKYFTSCKRIRQLIKEDNGIQNFTYEIRRTFIDANSARVWETKVLRRMNVINDDRFFNQTNNISIAPRYGADNHMYGTISKSRGIPRTEEVKQKIANSQRGKIRSEQTKKQISDAKRGKPRNYIITHEEAMRRAASRKGIPLTEEHKKKLSDKAKLRPGPNKGKKMSEEQKAKLSRIKLESKFKHTEESKQLMSERKKGIPKPPRTAEHAANLSASRKKTANKTCEWCSKSCQPSVYVQWHGAKCKLAPLSLINSGLAYAYSDSENESTQSQSQ